jgi:hypothetical protein
MAACAVCAKATRGAMAHSETNMKTSDSAKVFSDIEIDSILWEP